ncbi:hypothetical protein [Methylobacterium oxalidis]|uniref:hypothetical protein n=1 Tax=Methylobacterium oxalidis TaxID=944322 RepID=UPI0033155FBE
MGVYELELHSVIEKVQQQPVDIIINIGCAEGYYAIGAAKAFPTAKVFAFDLAESSQKVCALCARENGVEDRVKIGGLCTPEILHKLLEEANYGFVIVDIEGAEKTLLDIEKAPTLSKAHILVECHDFSDHSITPTLTKDFSYSHAIDRISEGARDPNLFNFCRGLNSLDRWIVMCEFRAMTMHWLSMRPLFGNI